MTSSVSTVSGFVAKGHQTMTSRFRTPPYDPTRSDFPGKASGYPASLPTEPDLKISFIRFLGNRSLSTTLAHNFAALQAP